MMAKMPPATQAATIMPSLPAAPATMDGVPKMPAPTMRPTIMATASNRDSVWRGRLPPLPPAPPRHSLNATRQDGACCSHFHFATRGLFRPPRGHALVRAFLDGQGALDRVSLHPAAESMHGGAGTGGNRDIEPDLFACQPELRHPHFPAA